MNKEYEHKDDYSLVIDYWDLDPQDPNYKNNKQVLTNIMIGRFIGKAIEEQEKSGRMTI